MKWAASKTGTCFKNHMQDNPWDVMNTCTQSQTSKTIYDDRTASVSRDRMSCVFHVFCFSPHAVSSLFPIISLDLINIYIYIYSRIKWLTWLSTQCEKEATQQEKSCLTWTQIDRRDLNGDRVQAAFAVFSSRLGGLSKEMLDARSAELEKKQATSLAISATKASPIGEWLVLLVRTKWELWVWQGEQRSAATVSQSLRCEKSYFKSSMPES